MSLVHTKTIPDVNGKVFKLIFEDDSAIAETVVYRYGCRGVICFSVQSGCRVGCSFCGTGKKFVRDLSVDEMFNQVLESLKLLTDHSVIQIMSMSMGEPMDNINNVVELIYALGRHIRKHDFFLSTVGLNDHNAILKLVSLFNRSNFGLQFSLHNPYNIQRKILLGGYPGLLNIEELRTIATLFKMTTGRRAYFNYICTGKETDKDIREILRIVDGHHLTCSVMCNIRKPSKSDSLVVEEFVRHVRQLTLFEDIEISLFNPEGQDTIGAGCGQLLYVQDKLNNKCNL